MKCNEIVQILNSAFPMDSACEWDRCHLGLTLGRGEKEVQKILVALDADDRVVSQAVEWGADLIVTHHPMLFRPVYHVTDREFIGNRVVRLIRDDICLFAAHTNYDTVRMGALAAEKMKLSHVRPLCEDGIGVIGEIREPLSLKKTGETAKEAFGLPFVIMYGEAQKEVRTLAIVPGAGGSTIAEAVAAGVDCLLTGDISHHEAIDANMQNLSILDGGHFGTEYMFIEDMCSFLTEKLPLSIEIRGTEVTWPCTLL